MRYPLGFLGGNMGKKIKLTKSAIDRLPEPETGTRIDYFDTACKGFGIRVSSNSKRFFVLKRVKGKLTRVMLKPYGIVTPEQARVEANKTISKLYDGIDINAEKAKDSLKGMTLADALKKYFETKTLKPRTVENYDDLFRLYLDDWRNKPIDSITKEMVATRHSIVSKRGKAAANNLMRTLRAVYNFANELGDDNLPPNPVKRLSNTDQWNKIERRQSVIHPKHLPFVFKAIWELDNPVIRDYFLLLLFTGARRREAACLKWESVDLEDKTFTLTITKNGKPLTLPMSDFIYDIFKRRKALRENDYVFPSRNSQNTKSGHLIDARKQITTITLITQKALNNIETDAELESRLKQKNNNLIDGVSFTIHDLRRTFASSISGTVVGGYELKRLLNHALGNDDVTAGYVIHSMDKLRSIMQECTDHILMLCGQKKVS
jgi:integrase